MAQGAEIKTILMNEIMSALWQEGCQVRIGFGRSESTRFWPGTEVGAGARGSAGGRHCHANLITGDGPHGAGAGRPRVEPWADAPGARTVRVILVRSRARQLGFPAPGTRLREYF